MQTLDEIEASCNVGSAGQVFMNECPHRSTEFRLVDCPSCRGSVELKVYKCSLHGECTVGKTIDGIHRCTYRPEPVAKPLRDKKPPTPKPKPPRQPLDDGSIVINANKDGLGQSVVMAWISESDKRIVCHASGAKKAILELLGQRIVLRQRGMVDTLGIKDADRLKAFAKHVGIDAEPVRPKHNLSDEEIKAGEVTNGKILLCPDTDFISKLWPLENWLELGAKLQQAGHDVLVCSGSGDPRFAVLPEGESRNWRETAAQIINAKLVIGVDGAAVHLAGTFDVPAIAILNTVPSGAFAHYPSVQTAGDGKHTTAIDDVLTRVG